MSCHHCRYCGCQCSSARWRRLLRCRSTLFGMRSEEIMSTLMSCSRGPTPASYALRATPFGLAAAAAPSAEYSNIRLPFLFLRPAEIKFGAIRTAVRRECALRTDGVGPLEDPVLP